MINIVKKLLVIIGNFKQVFILTSNFEYSLVIIGDLSS